MRDGMDAETIFEDLGKVAALHSQGRERAAARDPKMAAESWMQAASILRSAAASVTLQLAEKLELAAAASLHAGQPDIAAELADEAAARLRGMDPGGVSLPAALRLSRIGQLFCAMRRWAAASSSLEIAANVLEVAEDIPVARQHAQCLATLATAHHFAGSHAKAVAVFQRAAMRAENLAERTNSTQDRLALVQLENAFGRTLLAANQPEAAAGILRRAVSNLDALVEIDPATALRNLMAATLNKLGHAHAALGDRAAAAACLDRSVRLMRVLVEDEGEAGLAEDLQMAIQDQQRLCT